MASNLSEILARVDELKAQIDALRPINPEQEARLMQKLRLEWNYHSNALEGNKLTLGETRAFLLQGLTAQGKPFRDYLDIKGYNEAILLLEEFVRQERPLTEAAIRELHKIILVEPYHVDAVTFDGTPTRRLIEPGKYKTTPNHVQTTTGEIHYYASPEETPARMGDLMAWYRRELEQRELQSLVLAATFHYQFVAIHPFDDGNGRMARLLMNLILMQTGFVPVVVQVDTKEEYLLALEKADTGDLEDFITLIGRGLLRSMELYVRAARGESIEELGDLDKRIALLARRLESENVIATEKDSTIQRQLLDTLIYPFVEGILEQVEKFEVFFNESVYRISFKSGIKTPELPPDSPKNLLKSLSINLGLGMSIDKIAISSQLIGLIKDNKKAIQLILTFNLFKHELTIDYSLEEGFMETWQSLLQHGKSEQELAKYKYSHAYLQEEITIMILQIGNHLYQLVEQLVDSSTPQDPTAP